MAELKHKGCGGTVCIDIASQFTLRTHSIMITPSEVSLGVLELGVGSKSGKPQFVCNKCDARFDIDAGLEGVTSLCLACTHQKPISSLYISYHFPSICEDCKDEVSGKSKKKESKLAEVYNLSGTNLKFVSYLEVLKKPIS